MMEDDKEELGESGEVGIGHLARSVKSTASIVLSEWLTDDHMEDDGR